MENKILEISLLDNKQQFSISSLVWADPAALGIALVDLAKFLAETIRRSTTWMPMTRLLGFSKVYTRNSRPTRLMTEQTRLGQGEVPEPRQDAQDA